MKKTVLYFLIFCLTVCLVGCTSNSGTVSTDPASETDAEVFSGTDSYSASAKPSTATDSDTDSDAAASSDTVTDTVTVASSDAVTDSSQSTSDGEEVFFDPLREDYRYGTCKNLRGDVAVVLFFMDDFESSWTKEEIDLFVRNEMEPAFSYLEDRAKKYGVQLDLTVKATHSSLYYNDAVITSISQSGYATVDVLRQAAKGLNYASTERMLETFRSIYKTEEVVCFTVFDKNGTAYAINPKREYTGKLDEHCIVFSRDLNPTGKEPVGSQSSVIAHEMLHLYGAEDFYASSSRKSLAVSHYPNDLMLYTAYYLSQNTLGDATAFYIGWIDEAPSVLFHEKW